MYENFLYDIMFLYEVNQAVNQTGGLMTVKQFDLSIRAVKPHDDAERIGSQDNGNGTHTGGAWLYNDEVYKPLDGRPFMNATCHVPTFEVEMLEELSGQSMFPQNWRIEVLNHRRWLVRQRAIILPTDFPYSELLNDSDLVMIENAVRSANRAGWQIGDELQIGYDSKHFCYFFYDLSAASKSTNADDSQHFRNFRRDANYTWFNKLQANTSYAFSEAMLLHKITPHYIYASMSRPLSSWFRPDIDRDMFVVLQGHCRANMQDAMPHSWVCSEIPISQTQVKAYELTLAYVSWPLQVPA